MSARPPQPSPARTAWTITSAPERIALSVSAADTVSSAVRPMMVTALPAFVGGRRTPARGPLPAGEARRGAGPLGGRFLQRPHRYREVERGEVMAVQVPDQVGCTQLDAAADVQHALLPRPSMHRCKAILARKGRDLLILRHSCPGRAHHACRGVRGRKCGSGRCLSAGIARSRGQLSVRQGCAHARAASALKAAADAMGRQRALSSR